MKKNRHKKIVNIMAGAAMTLLLVGCGASDADKELKDMNVDKYVSLGTYKGLEISVDPVVVDDAQVDSLMQSAVQSYISADNGGITDRAVAMGDTINLDYSGKRDGVAFDGGTAQNQSLGIGSGSFIPGFEEGLVDVMPGETVDVPLSFPEDYWNEDLAGAEVVFTVTVNYIYPEEVPEDVIASMEIEGVTNAAEFRQYVYDYLYDTAENNRKVQMENTVLAQFIDGCVFQEFPDKLVKKYEDLTKENIERQASQYGMDAESFVSTYYYQTLDEFVKAQGLESLKQDIALQAVANLENLNVDDEELNNNLLEYATQSGIETVEEFIGDTPLEMYRAYFMTENVLNFLTDNAVISE